MLIILSTRFNNALRRSTQDKWQPSRKKRLNICTSGTVVNSQDKPVEPGCIFNSEAEEEQQPASTVVCQSAEVASLCGDVSGTPSSEGNTSGTLACEDTTATPACEDTSTSPVCPSYDKGLFSFFSRSWGSLVFGCITVKVDVSNSCRLNTFPVCLIPGTRQICAG